MANRRGREIPVKDYDARGGVIDGLPSVPRTGGEGDAAIASATGSLADTLGRIADEAAAVEGKRAGLAAGNDPGWRPTGDFSIRGRAFEEAAIKSYSDNLDARLRTDMHAVYEQNKDDPVKLKAALEGLHAGMSERDVFPEIQASFSKQFTTWSTAYQNHAATLAERRAEDGIRAGLFANIAQVDTATRQAVATLDPNDPAVEEIVGSAAARKTDMWRRAAAAGAVTQAQAELKIQESRNADHAMLVLARADRLATPGDVSAFRQQFSKDFAAGKYNGRLDATGYDSVVAELVRRERTAMAGARTLATSIDKQAEDFVKREVNGLKPPEAEWDAIAAQARTLPEGDALLALAGAKRKLAQQLLSGSIDQAEDVMASLRQTVRATGGGDPGRAKLVLFGDEVVKAARTQLNADQLGYAQQRGLVAMIMPLDFEAGDAGTLANQIRERAAQAHGVGASLERAPVFLRPEEKARIREIVNNGGDRALGMAQAIVAGAGADAPRLLNELGTDAPLIAQVGNLLANGGSFQAARDAFAAGRMKAEKLKVGSPETVVFDQVVREEYGTGYGLQPEDRSRAIAAARAISETRLTVAALDPKDNTAKDLYRKAVQEAAGATFVGGVQYGGVTSYKPAGWWWQTTKVAVPTGVRADSFRDVIMAVRDSDLPLLRVPPEAPGEKAYLARDLHGAVPVAVRGGYRFALGDPLGDDPKWIRGVDGAPFVLPLEQMLPELRKRVPGAFIGSR